MTRPGFARVVVTALVVVLVGGCGSPGAAQTTSPATPTASPATQTASAPTGGLSRAQAIAAAQQEFPDTTGVVRATQGRAGDFDPGILVVPANQPVWAVVLSGTFPFSCGPAPDPGQTQGPCPVSATTKTVLIDAVSGAFIEGFSSSGGLPPPTPGS